MMNISPDLSDSFRKRGHHDQQGSFLITVIATIIVLSAPHLSRSTKSRGIDRYSPRTVADHLHAVIMAHRNFTPFTSPTGCCKKVLLTYRKLERKNSLRLRVKVRQETNEMDELTGADVH